MFRVPSRSTTTARPCSSGKDGEQKDKTMAQLMSGNPLNGKLCSKRKVHNYKTPFRFLRLKENVLAFMTEHLRTQKIYCANTPSKGFRLGNRVFRIRMWIANLSFLNFPLSSSCYKSRFSQYMFPCPRVLKKRPFFECVSESHQNKPKE